MATQYKGKYPDRIKSISGESGNKTSVIVTTNDGKRYRISAASTGGEMPRLNESISAYHATAVTTRKQNPAPRKTRISRTNITPEEYVKRPSQITRKAPSKRAKTRRQTHLDAGLPPGYYPNPAKPRFKQFPYEIQADEPSIADWVTLAGCFDLHTARTIGQSLADKTKRTIRVIDVQQPETYISHIKFQK